LACRSSALPARTVRADVTLSPRAAAAAAEWLTATAWQGDGLVVDRLERVGPGRYRTTEPSPCTTTGRGWSAYTSATR